jgi:hypothetical protein
MAALSSKVNIETMAVKQHLADGTLTEFMFMRCTKCKETKNVMNDFFRSNIKFGKRRCKMCSMQIAKKFVKTKTFEFATSTGVIKVVRKNPRTKWQMKAVVFNRTFENWTGVACERLFEAFERTCVLSGETLGVSDASFLMFESHLPKTPGNGVLVSISARRMVGGASVNFDWSKEQRALVIAAHVKFQNVEQNSKT